MRSPGVEKTVVLGQNTYVKYVPDPSPTPTEFLI